FFFSSRRRHTRSKRDWSSDVCSSDLASIEDDPDGPYLFGDIPEANQPVESVLDILDVIGRMDFSLLGPPGKVFNYSNEGYALLQEIIERASGMTFTSYIDKQIMSRLNMVESVIMTDNLSE